MNSNIYQYIGIVFLASLLASCVPEMTIRDAGKAIPESYSSDLNDTTNAINTVWRDYFGDPNLAALIDTALGNNQELNIVLQELEMLRNEVQARKGEYLPSVGLGVGMDVDKVGRYTRFGALEANNEIRPGDEFPEPLGNFMFGAFASWEVDIWRKLRNAKQSSYKRYMAGIEGRNFLVTNLIAEMANLYFELLALDNQLELVQQNVAIQSNALEMVRLQKQAARVTELAVKRFEAQLLETKSLQYRIQQSIVETENQINFLAGRYPQPVKRNLAMFDRIVSKGIEAGIPSQLLENRPDIRQAELELEAAKLDVKATRANFYPSLGISAGLGFQAFNPKYLVEAPESLLYSLGGEIVGPLINRKAIKAIYKNANAKQMQAIVNYERTVLNAYIEVSNQLSNIQNLERSYVLKDQQVSKLTESTEISISLFKSARAEYIEVLLTQEEVLDSVFELIETKRSQLSAWVDIYRALGGGWK